MDAHQNSVDEAKELLAGKLGDFYRNREGVFWFGTTASTSIMKERIDYRKSVTPKLVEAILGGAVRGIVTNGIGCCIKQKRMYAGGN